MLPQKLQITARAFRVNQWIKNLVVFTGIVFSGYMFYWDGLLQASYAFIVFCLLSSTSYLLNDIIDYEYDKRHPVKKNRPVASGAMSIPEATFWVFFLTIVSLLLALWFSLGLFFIALIFIFVHFFYSLKLKNYPVIDIFTISTSFMLRTVGGEIATGYHIPIWLLLTIFFISLFMATVKRHAELVSQGIKGTRASLFRYKEHLLFFLTTTFATATIIAYSFYTYFLPQSNASFLATVFSPFEGRKWMMISIPFVVYGIARYAQLLYEREEGERPEKLITTDKPLLITIVLWVLIVVTLIYVI